MTKEMLLQCLIEAEARKRDDTLPMDVRIRSTETFSLLLRRADNEGLMFTGGKLVAKPKG